MLLLSIIAAFLQSTTDLIIKKLSSKINPYTLSLGTGLGIVFVNLPILFFRDIDFSTFNLNIQFFLAFIITAIMFAAANIFMNKAFSISDLSLVVPIINFTPLFTLLLQFLILRTIPNNTAIVGIFVIILGSYFLKLDLDKVGIFEPIKNLYRDRGAQYMLFVSFVWALDNILAKIGTGLSEPSFWTITTRMATVLITLPIAMKFDPNWLKNLKQNWFFILIMGCIAGISVTIINYLLAKYDPSIVTSLLRLATLFSVFYGMFVFKEKNALFRVVGVLVMIAGIVLISFS
jgi:drug/metabolite transporter (DMT)-like permease